MTLKTLAHRSAQALLNSPTLGPQPGLNDAPSLRDPAAPRAQRAEATGSRADFADALRERAHARADADATPSGKSAETSGDQATVVAATPSADGSDAADNPNDAPAAEPPMEADETPESTGGAASEKPTPGPSVVAETKPKPVTIQELNALLLQGQPAPRFALIAPEHRSAANTGVEPRSRARGTRTTVTAPSNTANPSTTSSARESVPPTAAGPAHAPDPAAAQRSPEAAHPHADPQAAYKTETPAIPPSSAAPVPAPVPNADRPAHRSIAPAAQSRPSEALTSPSSAASGRTADASTLLDRLGGAAAKPESRTSVHSEKPNQAFASQVQRGLAAALNQKTGAVSIRLTPETLGQLKIQVNLTEGSLTVAFEVASTKTRDTLARTLDTLRQSLKDKGIDSSEFKVTLAAPLPRRDLGLDPIQHPQTSTAEHGPFSNSEGQYSTAYDDRGSHHHTDDTRATYAAGATPDPAETTVDLAALSPDPAASDLGRSRYIALPDGRLGLVALA